MDANALAYGLLAQQMVHTVSQAAGSHTLDTKAVGGSGADDIGVNIGADIDTALLIFMTDHKISTSKKSNSKLTILSSRCRTFVAYGCLVQS